MPLDPRQRALNDLNTAINAVNRAFDEISVIERSTGQHKFCGHTAGQLKDLLKLAISQVNDGEPSTYPLIPSPFTKQDVEEVIGLLNEENPTACRDAAHLLSLAKETFAYSPDRKSV